MNKPTAVHAQVGWDFLDDIKNALPPIQEVAYLEAEDVLVRLAHVVARFGFHALNELERIADALEQLTKRTNGGEP
jgi:hypothetical protein